MLVITGICTPAGFCQLGEVASIATRLPRIHMNARLDPRDGNNLVCEHSARKGTRSAHPSGQTCDLTISMLLRSRAWAGKVQPQTAAA